MNIATNQKPYYKDGGNYYTPEDKDKIKQIQNKTNDLLRKQRRTNIQ
jgi:hypothetical protein